MKRDIPLPEIIALLQQLPTTARITVDTKSEIRIVGIVVERSDKVRQIAEIAVPKGETK